MSLFVAPPLEVSNPGPFLPAPPCPGAACLISWRTVNLSRDSMKIESPHLFTRQVNGIDGWVIWKSNNSTCHSSTHPLSPPHPPLPRGGCRSPRIVLRSLSAQREDDDEFWGAYPRHSPSALAQINPDPRDLRSQNKINKD